MLIQKILGNLPLPLVSIGEKLFLIIQQLLVCFGGKLKVWSFHNGIHWTSFCAKATVDTFGHVNVVTCCTTGTIFALLRLNRDSLGRTRGFAQLASNAALFSAGITTQGVLAAETRGQMALFVGVIDGCLGLEEDFAC